MVDFVVRWRAERSVRWARDRGSIVGSFQMIDLWESLGRTLDIDAAFNHKAAAFLNDDVAGGWCRLRA